MMNDMPSPQAPDAQDGLIGDLLGCREGVFLLCLGFARDSADAQDLAQETYAKALAHLPSPPPGNPRAWLLRIARNTCLDRERRLKVQRLFMPWLASEVHEWQTPEGLAGEQEETVIVKGAIRRLPRHQREVLVLREYGELSYKEISQVLKIGEGTVMSRLNRARQSVLRHFQERIHGKRT